MNVGTGAAGDVVISLGAGDDLQMGLSWDLTPGLPAVDLDAQALMFTETGVLADAAFYNQLHACGGAVRHSGDEKTGKTDGDDEKITFDFEELPPGISLIVIIITAHSGGSFVHVESAEATLRDLKPDGSAKVIHAFSIGCMGERTAAIMCVLYRQTHPGSNHEWRFRELGHGLDGECRNFQEAMPQIRQVVDSFVGADMAAERVLSADKTFEMHKSDRACLPPGANEVHFGLGWETRLSSIDLDGSCVLIGADNSVKGTVWYSNTSASGVQHSGDNVTGEGEGDDEVISVKLNKISPDVKCLAFVVNIYSEGRTFRDVHSAYVRLLGGGGKKHVLARYTLDEGVLTRGVVFALLIRSNSGWVLEAVGEGCNGQRGVSPETVEAILKCIPGASSAQIRAPSTTGPQHENSGNGCCILS